MSTEQTIFVMIALMAVGFLARSLPENVKEVAGAIGGLAALLGIVLLVIGYFTETGVLETIGMFLVAPPLGVFLGTLLLESSENAWNLGRSAGHPDPRKERGQQNQATGVKFVPAAIKAALKENQVTASDGGVKEAEKTVKKTHTDNQANS